MTGKYYRCCYTNDTWQTDGRTFSGWRTVAASPDLPQQARDTCGWMQSSVVPTRPVNLDEDGRPLNLLEVAGDGQFFYLVRTQYGLQDREGRANIFSHGYIFPVTGELIRNPAMLLAAAGRENFADSAAEAEKKSPDPTGSLPSLAQARESCGLDKDRWLTLIRCVYLQMTQRQALWPLYIQCRDEEEMKALLCCIYAALPRYLRGRLCASSAEMEKRGRNLIFVRSVAEKSHYLIPSTGENDLLTPRTIQRLERLEFVDYPVVSRTDDDREDYFWQLATGVDRLTGGLPPLAGGDPRQELIHKIAHQILCGSQNLTGEELEIRLADALRAPQSSSLDEYLAGLLARYSRCGLFLTQEAEGELRARLQNTHSIILTNQIEAYDRRRLLSLSPQEGAGVLAARGAEAVEKLRPMLLADPHGLEILDCYEAQALGEDPDWPSLWRGAEKAAKGPLPVTQKRLDTLAWQLYQKELVPGKAKQAFEDYMALVSRLRPDAASQLGEKARLRYWQDFSLTYASPDLLAEMNFFLIREDRRCQVALAFAALPICREKKGVRQFLRTLCDFYSKYRSDLSRMDGESAISRLRQRMEGQAARENDLLNRYIGHWMVLAVRLSPRELDTLLALLDGIDRGETQLFIQEAPALLEAVNRQAGGELAWLKGLLGRLWQQREKTGGMVPLDVWLSLALPGENPFLSLSALQPGVLSLPPKEVAATSRLLSLPQMRQYADEYQRDKGELARTVRQWMSAVRQLEKKGLLPPALSQKQAVTLPDQPEEAPLGETAPQKEESGSFEDVFRFLKRQEQAAPRQAREDGRQDAPGGEASKAESPQEPALEDAGHGDDLATLYASLDKLEENPSKTADKEQDLPSGAQTGWQAALSDRPVTSGASVRPLKRQEEPFPEKEEEPPLPQKKGEQPVNGLSGPSGYGASQEKAQDPKAQDPGRSSGASVRPQDTPSHTGISSYQPTPPRYFDQEFETLRSGASVRPQDRAPQNQPGEGMASQPASPSKKEEAVSPAQAVPPAQTVPSPQAGSPAQAVPSAQAGQPDRPEEPPATLLDRLKGLFRK